MKTPSFRKLYPPIHITPTLSPHRIYYSTSQRSNPASPLPISVSPKLSQTHPANTFSSSSTKDSPPTSLPHLTASSTVHVIPISHKIPTARSALAIGHVTFSNPNPLPLIRAHALQKGDVLAVARIAAITAAKKTSDWIPLCHSGVPIEGIRVRVEVVDGDGDGDGPSEDEGISISSTSSSSSSSLSKTPTTNTAATSILPTPTPSPSSTNRNQTPTSPNTSDPDPHPDTDTDPDSHLLNQYLLTLFQTPLPPHGGIRISVRVDTTAKTGVEMEALVGVVGAGLAVVDMCKGVDRGVRLEGVRTVWKRGGKSGKGGKDGKGKGGKGEWFEGYGGGGMGRVGAENGLRDMEVGSMME